jgi:hypothetical protein
VILPDFVLHIAKSHPHMYEDSQQADLDMACVPLQHVAKALIQNHIQ